VPEVPARREGSFVDTSIFLDYHLPNATTWFYFSFILAVTLYFQFSRLFCVRNLDLLTLFLFAPGLLLLHEGHQRLAEGQTDRGQREVMFGYGCLLGASAYWFGRTVLDLALVRRPTGSPNLTTAGLAFLGVALFVAQTSVAVRRTNTDPVTPVPVGKRPAPIEQVQDQATTIVQQAPTETIQRASPDDVRFWVERTLCMICHAAIVLGLLFIGIRHFQDRVVAIGMGTLYLVIPYTAYDVGRQLHHIWPTAFLVWAVFSYRRPNVSGWLLGLATGTSLFPVLLYPLWVGFYMRRGAGRFTAGFLAALALSVGFMVLVLWWGGNAGFGLTSSLNLPDWQPWKVPTAESIWTGAHWAYRLPLFVVYVAFLIGVSIWPSPKNLSHLIALTSALLIGVQFWHADRGGVYVLWYLPLLILMIFRPNLTGAEPLATEPSIGVVARLASAAWRRVRPLRPDPPKELAV
jgi:hypothetical protein